MRLKLKRFCCILAVLVILTLCSSSVFSAVPQIVNYQGSLSDAGGNPINATVTIVFSLYDDPVAGSTLWQESQQVSVTNGLFSVLLGADRTNPLSPTIFDGSLFLGVQAGADAEMTPRQPITSVGFSIRSAEADRLNGLQADEITLPAGAVMHFNLAACPTGWSDFAAGQGRTLVGSTSTLGGTVGIPLADLENRTHNHTVDPSLVSTSSSGSHSHSVDPPPDTTSSDGHNHIWSFRSNDGKAWNTYQLNGASEEMSDWGNFGTGNTEGSSIRPLVEFEIQNNTFYTNIDNHSHTFNLGAFNTASAGAHSHSVNIPNTLSSPTSATMPYVQLRVCQKD